MPTLSVKRMEETKQRLQAVARSQGTTVHTVIVNGIESALCSAEHQEALVAAAFRACNQMLATCTVLDGKAFGDCLRAKTRGEKVRRPPPIGLNSLVSAGK